MKNLPFSLPSFDTIAVFIAVVFTIISQHPILLESNNGRLLLLLLSWLPIVASIMFSNKIIIDKIIRTPIFIFVIWFLFLTLSEGLSSNRYLDMPNLRNLALSIGLMFIGYFLASKMREDTFSKTLFWACLIGGLIFSFGIYNYSFAIGFDVSSRGYAYGSKNSASTIIFSCLVYILLLPSSKKSIISVTKYAAILFMLYLILIMKSRATILGIFILLYYLVFILEKKKVRNTAIILTISFALLLIFSDYYYEIIVENILFGSRDIYDLEDVSSGRFSMLQSFPKLFSQNIFFGRGYYFIESFPLATLVQVGLIGSAIIFSFIYWSFSKVRTHFQAFNSLDLCVLILFYSLLLNGLFEEQTPFGPGAKSFLLWFPFGFVLYKRSLHKVKLVF